MKEQILLNNIASGKTHLLICHIKQEQTNVSVHREQMPADLKAKMCGW